MLTRALQNASKRYKITASSLTVVLACASLTGCGVAASGPASSPVQSDQASLATGIIPAAFFGMVVKAPTAQAAVATGARRLWDSGVSWAEVEPARGTFVWSALDKEVDASEAAGVEVTLTLGMTPQWASAQPASLSKYGSGATAMPLQLADWDGYVAAVAARYQGRIQAYEVWNAPEDAAYWSGNTAQMGSDMATLAGHTRAAVHAADAAALVVSPPMSSVGLAAFLMAGGGVSVDVVGSVLNAAAGTPEEMTVALHALRATMSGTSAAGKPVWNEQGSWTLPEGGLAGSLQGAYVARALLLNAGYGVQRMHWYAWDESGTAALALSDGQGEPTEAASAYSMAESWIAGASMNGCSETPGGVWLCQVVRDGRTAWVVWSAQPTESSSFGASTMTSLSGQVATITAGAEVNVGASPLLLQ